MDEEGVASNKRVLDAKALGARRVAGRVQEFDFNVANIKRIATVNTSHVVLGNAGDLLKSVRFETVAIDTARARREQLCDTLNLMRGEAAAAMVGMIVRDQRALQVEFQLVNTFKQSVHIPRRIDKHGISGRSPADEIRKILHRADGNLFNDEIVLGHECSFNAGAAVSIIPQLLEKAAYMYYAQMNSPVGTLTLAGETADCVDSISFGDGDMPVDAKPEGDHFAEARSQLAEYFRGQRKTFDFPMRLTGNGFRRQVLEQLCHVPFGKTVSYGELAAAVGNDRAARAVGGAVGSNPLSIIVPCHRVLAADGGIGGFGGGLDAKRKLLAIEGVTLKN